MITTSMNRQVVVNEPYQSSPSASTSSSPSSSSSSMGNQCGPCLDRTRHDPSHLYEFGLCSTWHPFIDNIHTLPTNVLIQGEWWDIFSTNLTASSDASSAVLWTLVFNMLFWLPILRMARNDRTLTKSSDTTLTSIAHYQLGYDSDAGAHASLRYAPDQQYRHVPIWLMIMVLGIDYLLVFNMEMVNERYQLVWSPSSSPSSPRASSSSSSSAPVGRDHDGCFIAVIDIWWMRVHTLLYALALITTMLGFGILACTHHIRRTVMILKIGVAISFVVLSLILCIKVWIINRDWIPFAIDIAIIIAVADIVWSYYDWISIMRVHNPDDDMNTSDDERDTHVTSHDNTYGSLRSS
jgi:hypothetical protein